MRRARFRLLLASRHRVGHHDGWVYGVEVEPDGAEVANRGSAVVSANGKSVQLVARKRDHEAGHQPRGCRRPEMATTPILTRAAGWEVYNDQGNDGGDARHGRGSDGGRRQSASSAPAAPQSLRDGSLRPSAANSRPVSVEVRASFKLANQSLSGGGFSVPSILMIRLLYRDVYGSENTGCRDPTTKIPWQPRRLIGQVVSAGPGSRSSPHRWRRWTLPFEIISIQVYASGWDYESMIRWTGAVRGRTVLFVAW